MRGIGTPVSGKPQTYMSNIDPEPQPERKLTFLDDVIIKSMENVDMLHRQNTILIHILNKLRGEVVANNEEKAQPEPQSINDKFKMIQSDMEYELNDLSELLSELENWI